MCSALILVLYKFWMVFGISSFFFPPTYTSPNCAIFHMMRFTDEAVTLRKRMHTLVHPEFEMWTSVRNGLTNFLSLLSRMPDQILMHRWWCYGKSSNTMCHGNFGTSINAQCYFEGLFYLYQAVSGKQWTKWHVAVILLLWEGTVYLHIFLTLSKRLWCQMSRGFVGAFFWAWTCSLEICPRTLMSWIASFHSGTTLSFFFLIM